MTIQLSIPPELENQLREEVRAGRYPSIEQALIEKARRVDDDLLRASGMSEDGLRADLAAAWNDRANAIDGESTFARLAAKSREARESGR